MLCFLFAYLPAFYFISCLCWGSPFLCTYQFVLFNVPSDNIKEVNQVQHSVSSEKDQAASLASDGRLIFVT